MKLHASEVTFIFFFFCQTVDTKRPAWDLYKMPSLIHFFAYSSSSSSPGRGSSHNKHINMAKGDGHLPFLTSSIPN